MPAHVLEGPGMLWASAAQASTGTQDEGAVQGLLSW